jgi:hypothetical protein
VDLKPHSSTLPPSSAVLPVDQDDDVDLCSDELAEILAEGPISHAKKSKVSEMAARTRWMTRTLAVPFETRVERAGVESC